MPLDPYTRQVHANQWTKMMSVAQRMSSYLSGFRQALSQSYVPDEEDGEGRLSWTRVVNNRDVETLMVGVTFKVINNKGVYTLFGSANGQYGNRKARIERWISVDEDPITVLNELITKFPPQYRKYFTKGSSQMPAYSALDPFSKIYGKVKKIETE